MAPFPFASKSKSKTKTPPAALTPSSPTTPSVIPPPPTGTDEDGYTTVHVKPSTPHSPSFRHSVHLIPTPGSDAAGGERPAEWRPFIYRWWAWGFHSGVMIVLALAIEVAIYFSGRNGNEGFAVQEKNVLSFGGHVSSQFLLSFFPTLFIAPLSFIMNVIWFWFRVYQPYIQLAQGDASAKQSVNMNYLSYNKVQAIYYARKNGHSILYTTGALSLLCLLFQPLASSFFEIKNLYRESPFENLKTQQIIGLSPEGASLTPYIAAAGYVAASVAQPLGDPPFVDKNWTTATFMKPVYEAAAVPVLKVQTTAIQTLVNCDAPSGSVILSQSANSSSANPEFTLTALATSGFGSGPSNGACSGSTTITGRSADEQYGAVALDGCATNGSKAETVADLQPVMFWFFNQDIVDSEGKKEPKGAAVFCRPTIKAANVTATVQVVNMTLTNITESAQGYVLENNVTGGELAGRAFNGVVFSLSDDAFINARATAVKSVLPGAMLKSISRATGGLQDAFGHPEKFVPVVKELYTRHLAIAAQGVYFVGYSEPLAATASQIEPRLIIATPTGHILAALLFVTGVMSIVLHAQHRRARRNLFLTHTPGSIAGTVAMTGRSGFGELLVPYDTDENLKEKLDPLRFRLDARTGAILADSDEGYLPPRPGSGISAKKRGSRGMGMGGAGALPSSPLAKAHFDQEQDVQMRLLGPDGHSAAVAAGATSPPPSTTVYDHSSSKVSFVDDRGRLTPSSSDAHGHDKAVKPIPGNGGPGGLLDVPYAWEPLPELHKTGTLRDDRTP